LPSSPPQDLLYVADAWSHEVLAFKLAYAERPASVPATSQFLSCGAPARIGAAPIAADRSSFLAEDGSSWLC
jgi:hypothetical protein